MKFLILSIAINLFAIGPFFDGKFYPKDKTELENYIKEKTTNASNYYSKISKDSIKAVIVPHAGYEFSGQIAAISYSLIPKDTELFVIFSPSHKNLIDGAVTTKEAFNTPLGFIESDKDFVETLVKNDLFKENSSLFQMEHSIEVQLPFIIYSFKKAKIVPILLNTYDLSKISRMAEEIKKTIDKTRKKTMIIISSDFSHYPDYQTAKKSDASTVEAIKKLDEYYFDLYQKITLSKNVKDLDTLACGSSAIMLGIKIAKLLNATEFVPIKISNSYEENKKASKENVVGYVSGIFISGKKEKDLKMEFTKEEKKELLEISKKSITDYFKGKKEIIGSDIHQNPKFNMPQAVFVTLYKNKYLRGCIGTTEPRFALMDAVKYFSIQAAFNDPRFSTLKEEELNDIKIEISILSRLKGILDYKEIREKKDGVIAISKQGSGLFLPQVWDYFKTKEEFLSELCEQKAGLNRDCWKNKETKLYTFTVDILQD
ncbi:MAG: AmmeMemoRadiSam system protein B [Elusimicrobiota bacterium]